MKWLSIIRHAKAERLESYPTDFARPLTGRGMKDSERIGEVLARLDPPVDYFLSSPAARAAQTTDTLVAILHYTKETSWQEEIYMAGANTLLNLLLRVPEDAQHVVLVGHNPGLEELSTGLCSGSQDNSILTMATATLAHFSLDINRWNQLRWGAGRLTVLIPAKALR
jgi:phosphohistidine phosphatase